MLKSLHREVFYPKFEGASGTLELFPPMEASLGISHSSFIPYDKRGRGLGTKAHEHRLRYAKYIGFKYLICTVNVKNEAQKRIMEKFHWQRLTWFETYCSAVILYGRCLNDIEPLSALEVKDQQLNLKEKEEYGTLTDRKDKR